jgi:uroporphyrin-III C-methyltransferase
VSGALPDDLNMAALADCHATTVVYMGRRTFAGMAEMLLANGLPGETPAMLAEGVSTENERFLRSTVAELASLLAKEEPSKAPALILYGALAPEYL